MGMNRVSHAHANAYVHVIFLLWSRGNRFEKMNKYLSCSVVLFRTVIENIIHFSLNN